jgi:DNA-binding NarL/FixJ family response regulator
MQNTQSEVLIVDDHPAVRASLRQLLSDAADIVVTGEAGDGKAAVELARSTNPDLILLDVQMPELRGDEAMELIYGSQPEIRVLAISAYDDQSYVQSMLENGAAGYITKDEAPLLLLEAIRSILANGKFSWVSPRARKSGGLLSYERQMLTLHQVDLLEQLLDGRSEDEIVISLGIDRRHVTRYLDVLMRQLGVDSLEGLKKAAHRILPQKSDFSETDLPPDFSHP